jgi:hypothetical protein
VWTIENLVDSLNANGWDYEAIVWEWNLAKGVRPSSLNLDSLIITKQIRLVNLSERVIVTNSKILKVDWKFRIK